MIVVQVNLVTNAAARGVTEVCRQNRRTGNADRVAGGALHRQAVARVHRNHTVFTVRQVFEQVRAACIGRHARPDRAEGRQVRWTNTFVQVDRRTRDDRVVGIEQEVQVVVVVNLVTNRADWREAKVGRVDVNRTHRDGLTTKTLQTCASVYGRNVHTVLAGGQVNELVVTIHVGQGHRQLSTRHTSARVQRHLCARDTRFTSIRRTILVVIEVNKVTQRNQRRKAEVCGGNAVTNHGCRLTKATFVREHAFWRLRYHTVCAVVQLIKAVNTVRIRGLGRQWV